MATKKYLFQVQLDKGWRDFPFDADKKCKQAYMTGYPKCQFSIKGTRYEVNFDKMTQRNMATKVERKIRIPYKFPPRPQEPMLPPGPMKVMIVQEGQPGTAITIQDPNNKGQNITIVIPAHAKAGQDMAVPIPRKGESVSSVQAKQKKVEHAKKKKRRKQGKTAAVILGATAAALAVAGAAVLGVMLADYFTDGAVSDWFHDVFTEIGDFWEYVFDYPGADDVAGATTDFVPAEVAVPFEDAVDISEVVPADDILDLDWPTDDLTDLVPDDMFADLGDIDFGDLFDEDAVAEMVAGHMEDTLEDVTGDAIADAFEGALESAF